MPLDTALLSANLLSSQIGLLKKGASKEIFTKVRQKAIETAKKKSCIHSFVKQGEYILHLNQWYWL